MGDVYLDACCIIYLIEGTPSSRAAVEAHLRALPSSSELLTSRLSRLECRVKPLRDRDAVLLARYDAALAPPYLRVVELTDAVIERATDLRASYGFRTPDALHLAAAIDAKATSFLTGDVRLARCTEIRVEVIAPTP